MRRIPAPALGLLLGALGILCFSLTVPLTKVALEGFSPLFIAIGRVSIAGTLAALLAVLSGKSWPERRHWPSIFIISAGISIGFPVCLSMALSQTGASHAGLVMTIIPLFTAIVGSFITKTKQSMLYWTLTFLGCLVMLAYVMWNSGLTLVPADGWLLVASIAASISYSVGARLTKEIGGLNTISWALIFILPLTIPCFLGLLYVYHPIHHPSFAAIGSFLYLALISQFLGFVPWYSGLHLGGIAKVSQIQLLQTFFTLIFSYFLLGDRISWHGWVVAVIIVLIIVMIKKIKD